MFVKHLLSIVYNECGQRSSGKPLNGFLETHPTEPCPERPCDRPNPVEQKKIPFLPTNPPLSLEVRQGSKVQKLRNPLGPSAGASRVFVENRFSNRTGSRVTAALKALDKESELHTCLWHVTSIKGSLSQFYKFTFIHVTFSLQFERVLISGSVVESVYQQPDSRV